MASRLSRFIRHLLNSFAQVYRSKSAQWFVRKREKAFVFLLGRSYTASDLCLPPPMFGDGNCILPGVDAEVFVDSLQSSL